MVGNTNTTLGGWRDSGLSATGTSSINISSLKYNELLITVNINNENNLEVFSVPKVILTSSLQYFRLGGYATNTEYSCVIIGASTSAVSMVIAYRNGTSYTNASVTKVYYR